MEYAVLRKEGLKDITSDPVYCSKIEAWVSCLDYRMKVLPGDASEHLIVTI